MKKLTLIAVLVFVVAVSLPLFAAEKPEMKVNVFTDVYKNYGNTTYGMGGVDAGYPWSSELEFPIDTWFTKLGIGVNLLKRIDITADYAWSIDDGAGTMKDRDWDDYLVQGDMWVYGEGNANIDAKEWNLDLKYLLKDMEVMNGVVDRAKLFVGFGYKNQKFQYDIDKFTQSSSYFSGMDTYYSGTIIDYSVEYQIPYLSLYTDIINSFKNFDLLLGFEYAPSIDVEDRDDHKAWPKYMEASGDGTYYKLAAQMNWNFFKNIFASAYYNYINIDASGSQDQTWYNGTVIGRDIDWHSESEQNVFGAKLTWYFE